ncbi:hypothetical protein LLG95_08635 [bacterium]|nr:hypothetical protein [bacterium]
MIRFIIIMGLFLFLGLQIEAGVLPQVESLLHNDRLELLLSLRLLALGAVIAGMMRGEIPGMLTGLIAALLAGFSMQYGWLGAGIVSFTAIGYLAGLLARHFRLNGLFFRWFAIFFLLVVERMIFFGVRWFFWRDNLLSMPWPGMVLTGLVGTILYVVLSRLLKKNLYAIDAEA